MKDHYRDLARGYRRIGIAILAVLPALMAGMAVLNSLAAATGSGVQYWVMAGLWAATVPLWLWAGISNLRTAKTYERAAALWPC